MSSDVMTQENWARLHVARRVKDIAKSMMRLSRLGRSTFPMVSTGGWEACNPRSGLRFRRLRGGGTVRIPPSAKPYPALVAIAGGDEIEGHAHRRIRTLAGAGCRVPIVPTSLGETCAEIRPVAGRRRHGGRAGASSVRRADLPVGSDPGLAARRRQCGAHERADPRQD